MPSRNRLLAALKPPDLQDLADALEPVQLSFKDTLVKPDQSPAHIYFPLTGVVSVVNEPSPSETVEVATIGREGMIGLPVVLGAETTPSRAFVQIPGEGLRIDPATFLRFVDNHPNFHALLIRYTMALLNQIAQSASCNRLHEVQERCARWLLQTHDRVDGDSFPLTQEFLGQMLGAHRPTVSIAAGMLQKAGVISYVRGVIRVIDRKGLEEASCGCYHFIAREYARLIGSRG
jgi:CRP-like cAMP-binding protein